MTCPPFLSVCIDGMFQNQLCCTCHLLDKGTCLLSSMLECLRIGKELLHNLPEIVSGGDFITSAAGLETLSLLEALVVRTKNDRHIPNGCLKGVVDAYSETSTHIGHICIMVDAGKQAETVDNQDVGVLKCRV